MGNKNRKILIGVVLLVILFGFIILNVKSTFAFFVRDGQILSSGFYWVCSNLNNLNNFT